MTKQPGKAIWTLGAVTLTLLRLPYWLIYYIPKRFRQHPQWTYRQALMNQMVRIILYHSSFVEVYTPIQLDEKNDFVIISSAEDHIYQGLLDDPKICPTTTGGTWYPSPYKPGENERVVLHFHGGAHAMGQGRASDVDFLANTLSKNLDAKVFCPSYRLASNPDCHFPAALQDAVTAYHYLLSRGIPPMRIVISGDSAGANLAVSLLRYIKNTGQDNLPAPSAALLFSPWLDIGAAQDPTYITNHKNYPTDYLPGNFTAWGSRAYIPSAMDPHDPHFSPLAHPFCANTPLWIQVGGLEICYDEGVKFAEAMRGEGNEVELHVEPLANHDIVYVGNLTGFEKEAKKAVVGAKRFLERCGKKPG